MAIMVSTGARTYFAYGAESTPGVAVAPTEVVPVSSHPTLNYDPGRKPYEVAAGDLRIDRYLTEEGATVKGEVDHPLFQSIGQPLTALCGLGATLTAPSYLTGEVYRAGQSFQFAGLLPKSWKLECKSKSPIKVMVGFDGIRVPTLISPTYDPATYVYPADQPYIWPHVQPVVTVGSTAPTNDVDAIEVDVAYANQDYYGANASTMPELIVPGPVSVKFKFTRLFQDLNEWNTFVQAGQVPGPLVISLVSGAHSVTLTLPSAYYGKLDIKGDLKSPIVQDIEGGAIIDGASGNLLSYVAA